MAVPVYSLGADIFSERGVVLAPCNRTTVGVLERSALSICLCMFEFTGKRGRKIVEEEEDPDDVNANE
jgi:hypothetical protein